MALNAVFLGGVWWILGEDTNQSLSTLQKSGISIGLSSFYLIVCTDSYMLESLYIFPSFLLAFSDTLNLKVLILHFVIGRSLSHKDKTDFTGTRTR